MYSHKQQSGSFYRDHIRPLITWLLRVRLKFLLQSLITVIVLILLLPFFIGHLDSKEKQKSLENEKALRKRFNKDMPKEFEDRNFDMAAPALHHLGKEKIDTDQKDDEKTTQKYGPRAVLIKNKIGNYEPAAETVGSAPGEGGRAVQTSPQEEQAAQQSIREFGFNMVASDKIAMVRTIPDTRLDECKYWHYPETEKLPTASVIIVFHNEGWSTLMRTVHSVIATSPKQLLKEVVMVDDFSDKVHLKSRLDEYIKQFNGLVKLYRNKERLGLIQTRTNGAKYATGDAIVFLDAHCECQKNWLVPLLSRIAYDRSIMAVPIIDSINWKTFAYRSVYSWGHYRGIFEWGFLYKESSVPEKELNKRLHNSQPYWKIMAVPIIDGIDWNNFHYSPVYGAHSHFRGIFEWGFLYKESSVPAKELKRHGEHESAPYWSPTHAGGLFAMDRKYFFELGGYDPGLQIWGGENFELSFKIWQCGGKIEWVPCSRVGHVYRNSMPYGFGKISPKIPVILHNYMRVVEVWLDDEFKEYFYAREPTIRGYDIGDISKQLEFKKKNKCKSFKWFMDNIAYEVYDRFPPPPPNKAWGEFKLKDKNLCWDTMGMAVGGDGIGTTSCHHYGGNQMYRLNTKGQIGVGERCILARGTSKLSLQFCPTDPSGPWNLRKDGSMYHKDLDKCVESHGNMEKLELKVCVAGKQSQQWVVNKIKTW